MIAEIGVLEFLQTNWVAISAIIGAAFTALATGAAFCVRAVWFHAVQPLIVWCRDNVKDLITSHKEFLAGIDSKVGVMADAQDQIRDQIGGKFEQHKVAITHSADGLIAHAEGKPDEAKLLAIKAKEAVR